MNKGEIKSYSPRTSRKDGRKTHVAVRSLAGVSPYPLESSVALRACKEPRWRRLLNFNSKIKSTESGYSEALPSGACLAGPPGLARQGAAWRGAARRGLAGLGMAGRGKARQGRARRGMDIFCNKPTSLESRVARALNGLGIEYIFGYPLRCGFVLDFFILQLNTDLEVDGPHHDHPRRRRRDGFRSKIIKERLGIRTVRISWRDIQGKSDEEIKQLIKEVLWSKE